VNEKTLTSQTFHGLKWSYTGTVAIALLQVGFTAVLARLIGPGGYGLIAMANVVIRFGSYFSEMGIGPALIQKDKLDKKDITSAMGFSIILGLFFFSMLWFLSPFLSIYMFKSTAVISIVRFSAISLIINGFSITSTSLLRRNLQFHAIAIIEILSYVIGYGIVGILFAIKGNGAWSLVFAALAQSTLISILSFIKVHHPVSLSISIRKVKQLYSYGSKMSFISFSEFIAGQLDTMFIGRFLGSDKLGVYNRAYTLVYLPIYNINNSMIRVLFPSFSRVQTDLGRLRSAYASLVTLVPALIIPICAFIFISAKEIVTVILGYKFIQAIPVVQILSIALPVGSLHYGGPVCDALAKLNEKIIIQISYLSLLILLFIFLGHYGLVGYAVALLFGLLYRSIAYMYLMNKILKIGIKTYRDAYLFPVISALIIVFTGFLSDHFILFLQAHALTLLFLKMSLAISVFVFCVILFPNRHLGNEMKNMLNKITIGGKQHMHNKYLQLYLNHLCKRTIASL
jgi:lipopolysaccharide exporter